MAQQKRKTTKRRSYDLVCILLVVFLSFIQLDRLLFARNKIPGIIRLILNFVGIGFVLWVVDIVGLIIGKYSREHILLDII